MKYFRLAITSSLIALASIVLMNSTPMASANGRVTQFERRDVGPFAIAFGTIPDNAVVGKLHLTMMVSRRGSADPILDATVIVTGRGPQSDKSDVGPLFANNNPIDLVFYEATTEVDRIGTWVFTVQINNDDGEATADFTVAVVKASSFSQILTWIAVVVFVVLIVLGMFPLLRQWGKNRKKGNTL